MPESFDDVVRALHDDGVRHGAVFRGLPDASQDVVLLDAERSLYARWWPDPVRVLRVGVPPSPVRAGR